MLERFYAKALMPYPKTALFVVLFFVALLGSQAYKVEIDASSETLLLQDDKDLAFTREVNQRYYNPDFLVITYRPVDDLLDDKTLAKIDALSRELSTLDALESVTSILNVPLLQSPPMPLADLLKAIPTLQEGNVDKALVRKELLESPIYAKNLVSEDFKTTALMLNFKEDKRYFELLYARNALLDKKDNGTIAAAEKKELGKRIREFKVYRDELRDANHETIIRIREIMDRHRNGAELFLGGANMIADDMVSFVRYDLETYGISVFALLVAILWFVFAQLRFVLLPVLIASLSVVATTGVLGLFGWEVTVISSNFISLQLIVTMSLVIHLIVRYRELLRTKPDEPQSSLVLEATVEMAKPCLFVIITTVAGFSSLVYSNILPVMNLGWMMSVGVSISLIITFLVFPAVLIQLEKARPSSFFEEKFTFTHLLADFAQRHAKMIFGVSIALALFSLSGASKLVVENSFINYFKSSTEIYKGMEVIDRSLGGTTPLDVVIDFPVDTAVQKPADQQVESDEFDDFDAEFAQSENEAQYWFTSEKMAKIERIHDYLEAQHEVGKVLSFATILKVGRTLNEGEDLDNLELALLYNKLPEAFRSILLEPYLSVENNQARFSMRIIDSQENLRRDELLKRIKHDIDAMPDIGEENVRLASMMLLYNNMLQSLFDSQIKTLGIVVLILMLMFLLLFKSFKIGVIAMIANIIPVGVVFGFMGWAGIPLDMMTITIAAISLGIAVDDTIHYIHRFKIEVAKDGDYLAAMHRSHATIGYAMYYTSVAIMVGFSVLVLSNFVPTIYFGLLTVLAMFMALTADLLLLPRLILLVKPFGPDARASQDS